MLGSSHIVPTTKKIAILFLVLIIRSINYIDFSADLALIDVRVHYTMKGFCELVIILTNQLQQHLVFWKCEQQFFMIALLYRKLARHSFHWLSGEIIIKPV